MLRLTGEWAKKPDQKVMDKHQYFKAMSGRRLSKIAEQLRLMNNQANKRNYDYTEEDIMQIEWLLNEMVSDTISRFKGEREFKL